MTSHLVVRLGRRGKIGRLVALLSLLTLSTPGHSYENVGAITPQRHYRWRHSGSLVQDRVFYILTLFQVDPPVRSALARSRTLQRIVAERHARIATATKACGVAVPCRVSAWLWSDDEIAAIGAELSELSRRGAFADLVRRELRPSGAFVRYADKSDAELIHAAWADAAQGMNHIMRVYGLGEQPRYPAIDAARVGPSDPAYEGLIGDLLRLHEDVPANPFFTPTLELSLDLLHLNGGDEAASFRLLDRDNASARAAVAKTRWRAFPYTAILVLGDGPDVADERISPGSKLRAERAAQLFAAHTAPFLIVSGGNVHPRDTVFTEALELKRELMSRYKVPASAIVIEPHARHTTTNLRNAARLMFRYGFPLERPAVVTTGSSHSSYVSDDRFAKRQMLELGYQAAQLGRRLSPFDIEFYPQIKSLQQDARDPRDP